MILFAHDIRTKDNCQLQLVGIKAYINQNKYMCMHREALKAFRFTRLSLVIWVIDIIDLCTTVE